MGLLDSDDSAVKNHVLYKNVVASAKNLSEHVEKFKNAGSTSTMAKDLGSSVKRVLDDCDKGEKQFAGFGGWKTFRADALAIGKALCDRYPTNSSLDGLRPLVKDHPDGAPSLLTPPDSAVKNHAKYKEATAARESMQKALASFKEKGGTEGLVGTLSEAVLRAIRGADDGEKQFPEFGEWPAFRKDAIEIASALCEKFPTHAKLDKLRPLVQDPTKRVV